MKAPWASPSSLLPWLLLSSLPARVLASNVLQTDGFTNCISNATISVQRLVIQFNKDTDTVTFDVAGSSERVQNVTASLAVYAYGKEVYSKDFNPCSSETFVRQLCPVPAGNYSAAGNYTIPSEYASLVPAIAYQIPNLDGQAILRLTSLEGGEELACVSTTVTNGKTASAPAAQYAAVGVASAALVVSGVTVLAGIGSVSSIGAIGVPTHAGGGATTSPTFVEVVGWFQTMAMSGMLSVSYPSIYRSFTQNFGFSTGLVSWDALQTRIDSFRAVTGGNLTHDSVAYLRNSTIVYQSDLATVSRRDISSAFVEEVALKIRQITTDVNGTSTVIGGSNTTSNVTSGVTKIEQMNIVSGIRGYVEELTIPQSNTFMTVLIMFAIVIGAIAAGILLFKVILEFWALFGTFPKRLSNFRQQYWWLLAKTITNLILLLYGVWTLYCVYQFTSGDSWAAKVLAGVTLALFTAILLLFTYKIWRKVHDDQHLHGSVSALYEDKETWRRYSLFYENYKRSYWWIFVPTIIYMFSKGCVIAAADGHGLVQTAGQLIIDSAMLVLLLWTRPFSLKSGNWINIIIQIVRVLSVACILIFVEELGFSQTTKTITGLVLVIMQAVLSGLLAILILVNSIITCVKANPHRRRRKEAEKLRGEHDELAPLDAPDTLPMYPLDVKRPHSKFDIVSLHTRGRSKNGYDVVADRERDAVPPYQVGREESRDRFASAGAPLGGRMQPTRNPSQDSYGSQYMHRQPQLPDIGCRGGFI